MLHFVVIGLALFAADRARSMARAPLAASDPQRVVVGDDVRSALAREYALRFGQAPDAARERSLVDDWVRDEVLVREAVRLGLDRGDPIVRRRLAQKMELVLEAETPIPTPSEDDLATFLAAHRDAYRLPARTSFTHVFFAHERRGDAARADAQTVLASGTVDPSRGDAFPLGPTIERRADSDLTGTFGAEFVQSMARAPLGTWFGPVSSRLGEHLVLVRDREAERDATLAEVRTSLLASYAAEARVAAVQRATDRLIARYHVVRSRGAP